MDHANRALSDAQAQTQKLTLQLQSATQRAQALHVKLQSVAQHQPGTDIAYTAAAVTGGGRNRPANKQRTSLNSVSHHEALEQQKTELESESAALANDIKACEAHCTALRQQLQKQACGSASGGQQLGAGGADADLSNGGNSRGKGVKGRDQETVSGEAEGDVREVSAQQQLEIAERQYREVQAHARQARTTASKVSAL
jgi:hypothetical protein